MTYKSGLYEQILVRQAAFCEADMHAYSQKYHIRLHPADYQIPREYRALTANRTFSTAVSNALGKHRAEIKRKASSVVAKRYTNCSDT